MVRICAVTMVYRDYWALSKWYTHYSTQLGAENLFIISHGYDEKVYEICQGSSVIVIPRHDLSHFDAKRATLMNSFQTGLLEFFDWVIRTDADELICLDPAHFSSFEDLFSQQTSNALFAMGLNIAGEWNSHDSGVSTCGEMTNPQAVISGHYSKAWAVRGGVDLRRHGVKVRRRVIDSFEYVLPKGVYLAHLKFANQDALEYANRHRHDVASGKEKGLPDLAWRKPTQEAIRFFQRAAEMEELDWDTEIIKAQLLLNSTYIRDRHNLLIHSTREHFIARITLPDWFKFF
jgi:hypothetical protein